MNLSSYQMVTNWKIIGTTLVKQVNNPASSVMDCGMRHPARAVSLCLHHKVEPWLRAIIGQLICDMSCPALAICSTKNLVNAKQTHTSCAHKVQLPSHMTLLQPSSPLHAKQQVGPAFNTVKPATHSWQRKAAFCIDWCPQSPPNPMVIINVMCAETLILV